MNREAPPPGRVERVKIPDRDILNWIKVLKESGISEDEIEKMMVRLNRTFAEAKGIDGLVEKELERIEDYLLREHGRKLSKAQKEYLRESIRERFE
jgi:DNA-binding transcriptional MerR regulator